MDVISTGNLRSELHPSAPHLLFNQSVNVDEAAALQRHLPRPTPTPTSSTLLSPLAAVRLQTPKFLRL